MDATTRMPADSLIALGIMARQLGFTFLIDSNGKRWMSHSEFQAVYDEGNKAIANHERMCRICEGLLRGLHEDDKSFIYDAFAACACDVAATFEEPKRRAA